MASTLRIRANRPSFSFGPRTSLWENRLVRMAGDDSAKRQKTSQDGVVIAKTVELRGRIQQSSRTGPPPAGPGPAGSHGHDKQPNEGRPSATVTVDLSRVDTSVVAHISSFLGTSLELRNLALTCKSFGWRLPTSTLNWSLVEEVARQVVSSGRNTVGARVTLSPYVRGTTTWLSILRESEYPLKFDTLLGRGMEHTNERRTSVRTGSRTGYVGTSSAFASNYVMESGIHYAEFHIVKGRPYIGIVRPMPNLDLARYASGGLCFFDRSFYDDFLAARTDEWGSGNVHACYYFVSSGRNYWTNWAGERQPELVWEGMEGCIVGDTLGMLLNLDKGTLTVYRNNRRLGVMKDELSGSYCWSVELPARGTSVVINRGHPPHPHGARE